LSLWLKKFVKKTVEFELMIFEFDIYTHKKMKW